jgi:uncharacterized protein (TIGR02449 family)
MDELYYHLQVQIKALLQEFQRVKQDNLHLKQAKSLLLREKEQLTTKLQHTAVQIEMMLARLKSLEKPQ